MKGPAKLGLDIRLLDGRVVVTGVERESSCIQGGRQAGMDHRQDRRQAGVNAILKAAEAAYSRSGMVAAYKVIAVLRRLHAQVGSGIGIDFLDCQRKARPSRHHRGQASRRARELRQSFHVLCALHVQAGRRLGAVRFAECVFRCGQRSEAIR